MIGSSSGRMSPIGHTCPQIVIGEEIGETGSLLQGSLDGGKSLYQNVECHPRSVRIEQRGSGVVRDDRGRDAGARVGQFGARARF